MDAQSINVDGFVPNSGQLVLCPGNFASVLWGMSLPTDLTMCGSAAPSTPRARILIVSDSSFLLFSLLALYASGLPSALPAISV